MGWTSRPDRREITLLLCCLTVYLISYNIDSSLKLLGLNPGSTQGFVLTRLGIAGTKYIDTDGRKPEGWRDIWEDETYGKWAWDSNHIAGDGFERSQPKGSTRHGAMWMSKADVAVLSSNKTLGATTVDRAVLWWENDLPSTKLLKHVPGALQFYTPFPPEVSRILFVTKATLFSTTCSYSIEQHILLPRTAPRFPTSPPSLPHQGQTTTVGRL